MDHSTTTRKRPRARLVSRVAILAALALVLGMLQSGIAAAGWYGSVIVVHQGQSIQAAVNKAASGDTIKIDAGYWTEAVCVKNKGLTIVGAGRDRTIIRWRDWNSLADLKVGPLQPDHARG